MDILVVNAGSTSVKLTRFTDHQRVHDDKFPGDARAEEVLPEFCDGRIPKMVGHRVVHGGAALSQPVFIDDSVAAQIDRLSELAPLHNPFASRWIAASRRLWKDVPAVAIFDTGFFADLPSVAARYALPRDLGERYGIRRYGFHGIAHQAMWQSWCEIHPELERGGRLISLQLGGGASAAAIDRGRPIDTSMGFSPVEGLIMATRSGDLDPEIVLFLARKLGDSAAAIDSVERILNQESGLLGLSGGCSADMEELLSHPSVLAGEAVSAYCYRAKKYVGAYLAALGGADGIVFGGGVGENAATIQNRILEGLEPLGICLDKERNAVRSDAPLQISARESLTDVWVVPIDEARVIARKVEKLATTR
ncbi:acetate/propionate family kinase [Thiohalomonas denitrificans]|uniref:Acetate kinase n=1 Tax=Thiohalomonas denitrificans TaxID=415747 RepID=A0A1G5Q2F9_9GAMM|nr:acetate/propionate family kinase [Thiohalomonas denitrificans]SCZ55640.1 acetate kinase [Thiohalomonas denitrificans]